jgi:hypothetical protein
MNLGVIRLSKRIWQRRVGSARLTAGWQRVHHDQSLALTSIPVPHDEADELTVGGCYSQRKDLRHRERSATNQRRLQCGVRH